MRWSKTLIPTLRDDPQEAEINSHKLMLRAGLIRRLSGGLYTFLPLGLRALRKVETIIREEMDQAGALEILMPALQPRELWERSGRYEAMGDVMFRLKDRQDRESVLGPTHEEVVTDLVSHEVSSYRQLPKTLYQIQTKFRDEIRPRFGLMRAKEFIMKDAYSFDIDWETADASYEAMYNAYKRIFERCGLRTKVVEADTGAMGGNWSHEFMVLADSGEDGIVECDTCEYAANLERAERARPEATGGTVAPSPIEEVSTPGARTIEEVAAFLDCSPACLIKTLVYVADGRPTAVLIPGDREINESKLLRALHVTHLELADDETIEAVTGAPVGFAGPIGLKIPIVADLALRGLSSGVTGANRLDAHLVNVDMERDTGVEAFHDLETVIAGDTCPRCGGSLIERRGIEVGHVFKLGTKYTESFGAMYLDENGKQQLAVMGCYGIGVTRVLQSIVEQSHDERGIVWPVGVAPYIVHVLVMNTSHEGSAHVAAELVRELESRGIDVLLDDRNERPGVKFNDADLLGLPVRIVIGERSLAKGGIEIKTRTMDSADLVDPASAPDRVANLINGLADS
jgi:prolyl-tRNA synthetase